MVALSLLFLLGDVCVQFFPVLPASTLFYSVIFILVISFFRYRFRNYLYAFLLGMAWTYWVAHHILAWQLPMPLEGKSVLVTGYIASIPEVREENVRFEFAMDKLTSDQLAITTPTLLRLAWHHPTMDLKSGARYQLRVRLKRIHGLQNPGGFDFEAWSLEKGIRAAGYVINSNDNQYLSQTWYHHPVLQLREKIYETAKALLPDAGTFPWLMALVIGERINVRAVDWDVLRATGTNHLMAIGGLHIGFIAGFAHLFVLMIWRRLPVLPLYVAAGDAAAIASLVTGLAYSALAGFSIPTQRACLMLTIMIMALLLRKKLNPWQMWSTALLIVLLFNPLDVLSESFWLSFGTIALIIYGMHGRLSPQGWWWKWGRVQAVIGLGLVPLSLLFFQEISLISVIANCVAIPWMGFLILPFCFFGAISILIFPKISLLNFMIADFSLHWLWRFLMALSTLSFSTWHHAMPSLLVWVLSLFGILLLMLPKGMPGRWLGLIWCLPLIFYLPSQIAKGNFEMTLLDVGQGLSVVIQTRHHTLVYDAGLKFGDNVDMGESVVYPYLIHQGVNEIDKLVVSHGDNDHIGGAFALIKRMKVKAIETSVPTRFAQASLCLTGESWEWDGVKFSFLYPDKDHLDLGNNSSCVLKIENASHQLLLTGDIEKEAERELVKITGEKLKSQVLIAPHHGSKTSSTVTFIQAVQPDDVLYATGYRNRYHFPHALTVRHYESIGAQQFNTSETGAIKMCFAEGKPILIDHYRSSHHRYWMSG